MTVLINVYYTSKPVNEGTTASYRMLKYCDIGLRWEKWFVIPALWVGTPRVIDLSGIFLQIPNKSEEFWTSQNDN